MGLFKAMKEIAAAPIRVAKAAKDDLTDDDETKAVLTIATLGTSRQSTKRPTHWRTNEQTERNP